MIRQILNANMLKLIGKSFLSEKQKVNSYCIQIYCCQNVEKAHLCLEIAFNGMSPILLHKLSNVKNNICNEKMCSVWSLLLGAIPIICYTQGRRGSRQCH